MIEKWKKNVDIGGESGTLMADLSKAFDCSHFELLVAKTNAFGFDIKLVKLIKKKTKG